MSTTKIKPRHFECIKEDNSESENERQWKRSKIVFEEFHDHLKGKGLKESTCDKRANEPVFFIMDYLFVYHDETSMLDVDEDTIRTYLGNWYIRKFWDPSVKGIKSSLKAISDFYTFLHSLDFIDKEEVKDIKLACKDLDWFEMRLKTYFEADGENFREWLEEYDYGF
jgi:hypothetical protein